MVKCERLKQRYNAVGYVSRAAVTHPRFERGKLDHYIVVVDDEPGILDTLCEAFEMEGYRTACVEHPGETERSAAAQRPDLFLIDLMLPGMDGITLARHLREQGFLETPMIAMSASNEMVRAAKQSGLFQDTIAKPFDIDAILDTVEQLVA